MQNLIAFLIKNISWFLFFFLEVISFCLIFQYNSYQKSIFFNSSNETIGHIYSVSGEVTSYFGLKRDNRELLLQNAELKKQILDLESHIDHLRLDSLKTNASLSDSTFVTINDYTYTTAHVVNNSISRIDNYIMINKGKNAGITTEMGVVSKDGIVGFVRSVSPNYALVQSVLSPKTQLNCKILRSNIPTTLVWDTKDPRYADLKDFPRYEKFEQGDTVVTSGISKFFPEGFVVGTIESFKAQKDDNFYTLKIKLATDFGTLKDVLIINNYHHQELTQLGKEVDFE